MKMKTQLIKICGYSKSNTYGEINSRQPKRKHSKINESVCLKKLQKEKPFKLKINRIEEIIEKQNINK